VHYEFTLQQMMSVWNVSVEANGLNLTVCTRPMSTLKHQSIQHTTHANVDWFMPPSLTLKSQGRMRHRALNTTSATGLVKMLLSETHLVCFWLVHSCFETSACTRCFFGKRHCHQVGHWGCKLHFVCLFSLNSELGSPAKWKCLMKAITNSKIVGIAPVAS